MSPHRPLLDAPFDYILIGQVGLLLRIFINQTCGASVAHKPDQGVYQLTSHLASYSIADVALQDHWLCVILQSLWSQAVPLFMTPQAFLLLLHWSLLWKRAEECDERVQKEREYKAKHHSMREYIYISVPPEGSFVAGSVNEQAVRQNLNCSSHWC